MKINFLFGVKLCPLNLVKNEYIVLMFHKFWEKSVHIQDTFFAYAHTVLDLIFPFIPLIAPTAFLHPSL